MYFILIGAPSMQEPPSMVARFRSASNMSKTRTSSVLSTGSRTRSRSIRITTTGVEDVKAGDQVGKYRSCPQAFLSNSAKFDKVDRQT